MMVVQVLMVVATVGLFVLGLSNRAGYRVSAWKKILFALLMVVTVLAVLSPDLVTQVAQLVGVGRGTDLVLYVVTLAFGFFVVSQYLYGQQSRGELHKLARRIAVVEAQKRYGFEKEVVREAIEPGLSEHDAPAGRPVEDS